MRWRISRVKLTLLKVRFMPSSDTDSTLSEPQKILIETLFAQTSPALADDQSASATKRWQRVSQSKRKIGTNLFTNSKVRILNQPFTKYFLGGFDRDQHCHRPTGPSIPFAECCGDTFTFPFNKPRRENQCCSGTEALPEGTC